MRRDPLVPARARSLALLLLAAVSACGGRAAETEEPAPAPNLAGVRVMILPVQAPAPGQIDAELAFWLADHSPATDWVPPAELERAVRRSPALRLRLDALPRPVAQVGGERRVLDPLYGALRQLGAVVDADYALVPLDTQIATDTAGTTVTLAVALVNIRGGIVVWLHTLAGEPGDDPGAAAASAAEKLARMLAP